MTAADVFAITLNHGYIPQILLAEAMFTVKLRRRSRFWLRLGIGLPVTVFLMIVIPNMFATVVSGFFSLNIFLLSLALCAVLFENKFTDILFCCVGAQFTQNLSYNVENLIYRPWQDDISQIGWLFISIGSTAAVYTAAYFLCVRRMRDGETVRVGRAFVFAIAIVNVLFVYVMQYLFQYYGIDKMWITRLPLIVCCVFGLIMQFGLLAYKDERAENDRLEYFLKREREQYETTENTIDIINMKAHDLKHHIRRAQSVASYDSDELAEIAEVVGEYENTVKTGNGTLDVILTEKQYRCKQNDIVLSIIADSEQLAFMHTSDLVAVFGNALDNAIECELRVGDVNKRCIAVRIVRKGGMVSVHIENYCEDRLEFADGLPRTTKSDTQFHGFGMKSIRYSVEKYGGTVQAGIEGDLFCLNILIPIPDSDAEQNA